MEKSLKYWYIVMFVAFVVWGTLQPPLKVLSSEMSHLVLNLARFGIAGLFLLPFVLRQGIKVSRKDLLIICFLGLIGIFFYGLLDVTGLNLSSAINNSILVSSAPLIVILLAPFLINEKVSRQQVFGTIIGFVGVVLIVTNGVNFRDLADSSFFIGNVLILASAFCIAVYTIFNKKYIQKYGGLKVTFYAVSAGALAFLVSAFGTGNIFSLSNISPDSFLLLLWIAIPTTALSWVVWFKSIDKIGLVKTNAFLLLLPVSGILSSRIFLKEQITVSAIAGTILILIGIYVVQKTK